MLKRGGRHREVRKLMKHCRVDAFAGLLLKWMSKALLVSPCSTAVIVIPLAASSFSLLHCCHCVAVSTVPLHMSSHSCSAVPAPVLVVPGGCRKGRRGKCMDTERERSRSQQQRSSLPVEGRPFPKLRNAQREQQGRERGTKKGRANGAGTGRVAERRRGEGDEGEEGEEGRREEREEREGGQLRSLKGVEEGRVLGG